MVTRQYTSLSTKYGVNHESSLDKREIAATLAGFGQFSTYDQRLGAVWDKHIKGGTREQAEYFLSVCDDLLAKNKYVQTHAKAQKAINQYRTLAQEKVSHEAYVAQNTAQYDLYAPRDISTLEAVAARETDLFEEVPERGTYGPAPAPEKIAPQARFELPQGVLALAQAMTTSVPGRKPAKAKRTSPKYSLSNIKTAVGYAAKAAAVALATLLPMKAYAPTSITQTTKPVIQSTPEHYASPSKLPNLHLVAEAKGARVPTPEVYETSTLAQQPAATLEAKLAVETIEKAPEIRHFNLTLTHSPAYVALAMAPAPTMAEYTLVNVGPHDALSAKPKIPDSFWEVKTPGGQRAFFYAGIAPTVRQIATPNATTSSNHSEFIDAAWFARAKVEAERMKRIRQPITKEYLAERMKPVEERIASKPN